MRVILLALLILAAPSARAECVEHADESVTCDKVTSEAVKAHILDLRRDLAISRAATAAANRKLAAALAVVVAPAPEPDVWRTVALSATGGALAAAVFVWLVK